MTGADMDRATSELKDHADKLIFIRGINFKFSRNHDGGPVAAGTGAPITGSGTKQLPVSESADFYIARTLSPGQEPLTLYAGRKNTFRDDAFSFSTGGKLRIGDNNPWNVYQRLSGLAGMVQTDPGQVEKIAARRLSINDVVRTDMQDLLKRTDLSKVDRERLDLHFSSIRDMEGNMGGTLGPLMPMLDTAGMMAVNGTHTTDANMEKVVKMQLDLIAFAFASDRARSASLQVGGCNDHTKYTINGVQAPPYHFVSHRVLSDGGSGTRIANAVELHHQIDRIHARYFKHFLDRLAAYSMPERRDAAGCEREPVDQLDRRRAAPQREQRPAHHRRRGGGVPEDRPARALAGGEPPGAEHDHQRGRRAEAERGSGRQLRRSGDARADRRGDRGALRPPTRRT